MLRPLGNSVLFCFLDDTKDGRFIDRSAAGIILTNRNLDQSGPRWGKVLAVGPEVKEFKNGDYILIEGLQWTSGFTYDDVKIWRTVEPKVMAVTDDISQCYML